MRLAACALSAVLLSGCSWLGMGGGHGDAYGYNNYGYGSQGHASYGVGCAPVQSVQAPVVVASPGCAPGQGYAVSGGGQYGSQYGSAGSQYGSAGGQYGSVGGEYGAVGGQYASAGGYATGAYGAGSTVLSSQAPYGAAVGGQYGGGAVQTIQGSPMYVAGPAGAYGGSYGGGYVGGMGLRGPQGPGCFGGANCGAMPFGLELSAGTEFDIGGDVFTQKDPGLALGSATVNTGGSDGIGYNDAFGQMKTVGATLGYDLNRSTMLHGGVSYATANGSTAERYQSVDARSPGTLEDIDAEFSDLDLWTIEGGVRKYVGHNPAFRPYVGASAGVTHNNSVDVNRTYSSDGANFDAAPFEYIESGWNPTAATTIGAEMAVGHRAAIGVETGIRWRKSMDTIAESDDRWSIPVSLRGRVAF